MKKLNIVLLLMVIIILSFLSGCTSVHDTVYTGHSVVVDKISASNDGGQPCWYLIIKDDRMGVKCIKVTVEEYYKYNLSDKY